ncbi:M20/M25/M40 family metallo-hydrolase [Naumannella huperziae]
MHATTPGRHRLAAALAILLLGLAGALTATPRAAAAPPDPMAFAENLDRDAIAADLAALQKIADENGGNRADGTPGGDATVEYLATRLAEAGYDVQRQTFTTRAGHESVNLIAETPTGRTDNVIMLGAHWDGVEAGAGMNDNASGTAALLQVATELADFGALNNQVRFAFWGAEETGLEGSRHYVGELSEDEVDQLVVYYNYDMIGSPNYLIGVENGKAETYNDKPLADGSAQAMDVQSGYFDAIGQPWQPSEMCCTDYNAFHDAGVPIGGLYTGGREAPKTEEEAAKFGGTAGEFPDPNYHSAGDDLANVSLEGVGINAGVMAYAAASLGLSSEPINGVAPPAAKLDPSAARPGAEITISGSGFVPGEPIEITIGDQPVATVRAGEDGALDARATVPDDAPAGATTVTIAQDPLAPIELDLEVESVPAPSPTGSPSSTAPSSPTSPSSPPGGDETTAPTASAEPTATASPTAVPSQTTAAPAPRPRPPGVPLASTGGPAVGAAALGVAALLAGAMLLRRRT